MQLIELINKHGKPKVLLDDWDNAESPKAIFDFEEIFCINNNGIPFLNDKQIFNEPLAAFQKTLETLGINMTVRTVDSSQYQARMLNYDFDMIKNSWRVSLSPGNEQQFYWGSEVGKKEGSKNYTGINSPVVDFLIEKLIGAKTRDELTTTIHALDRVLLWGHYVIPLYHSAIDRIAYWDFLEYPDNIPLYGIVIESWWANLEKQQQLKKQ